MAWTQLVDCDLQNLSVTDILKRAVVTDGTNVAFNVNVIGGNGFAQCEYLRSPLQLIH